MQITNLTLPNHIETRRTCIHLSNSYDKLSKLR